MRHEGQFWFWRIHLFKYVAVGKWHWGGKYMTRKCCWRAPWVSSWYFEWHAVVSHVWHLGGYSDRSVVRNVVETFIRCFSFLRARRAIPKLLISSTFSLFEFRVAFFENQVSAKFSVFMNAWRSSHERKPLLGPLASANMSSGVTPFSQSRYAVYASSAVWKIFVV